MKICIIHSSDEGIEAGEEDPEDVWPEPGLYTNHHTFENRLIVKDRAHAQIDDAVAGGFDFYINFMWGTHDDAIAGVEAIRYFESLNLPFAGNTSFERSRSKFDFFADATRVGSPPIPGTDKFPLFVKPAFDFASKLIDGNSLCRDEAELEATVQSLGVRLRGARLRRATALGLSDPDAYVKQCEAAGRSSDDLVVQEFIDGEEYSVVVLKMGEVPVPLTPLWSRPKKKLPGNEQFLTYELKYDAGSLYELLSEEEHPDLYAYLQRVAVEAFWTSQSHLSNMGCEVDFRVDKNGKAYVIEVDPLPVWFFPPGSRFEDLDVKHDLPGQHRAALNVFITNYFLQNPDDKRRAKHARITEFYDTLGPQYEQATSEGSGAVQCAAHIAASFPHDGMVLDLACRTGVVGRALTSDAGPVQQLIGVDSSTRMLDICRENGRYAELVHQPIVPYLGRREEQVDHIFCLSGLQFLFVEELDFVLVRCFQLAKYSITLMLDDNPVIHSEAATPVQALAVKHEDNIESFALPRGWCLAHRQTMTTGPETKITIFRFERQGKAPGV
ncbi:hypothetical protein BDV28DRAFT_9658 [Aspergillus coremiiformis]|uniref:ATP-grasp domain-containing protein n=1 Tax=Aspergillus coremiiformis TaxID=138285 RepID=A0A5N6Z2U0_9EURO|nr:hypothetical protein BDV28DRAFT_9658 [Aspergillus coremiiformis]